MNCILLQSSVVGRHSLYLELAHSATEGQLVCTSVETALSQNLVFPVFTPTTPSRSGLPNSLLSLAVMILLRRPYHFENDMLIIW